MRRPISIASIAAKGAGSLVRPPPRRAALVGWRNSTTQAGEAMAFRVRVLIDETDDPDGLPVGEYVVDDFQSLGITRTVSVVKGILCQDDRDFIVEGKLKAWPESLQFEDAVKAHKRRFGSCDGISQTPLGGA